MPTLQFYGFTAHRQAALVPLLKERLADLPFRADIVFVLGTESEVVAWEGARRPFIRVASRSPERADLIRQRIAMLADVETQIIGFYPRQGMQGGATP